MVNKSTTHPIMRSHYHEKATKNASELISQIEAMKVAEDCGTTELVGKAGDVFVVNTRISTGQDHLGVA